MQTRGTGGSRFKANTVKCSFTSGLITLWTQYIAGAKCIHERPKKDRLNSPAQYWACNDRPWPSPLFISYKKPFSASLLPARSLCQSQAKVLHFITLAVCWEQLRSHMVCSLLDLRAASTSSVRYPACKKLPSSLRSFPKPKAALSSDSTKPLRCFSAVFTVSSFAKKAGVREFSLSPVPWPLPGFGKQVHMHSRLAGDGSGDLWWDMKHFSQRLLALHWLSRGLAATSMERADNCGSGGRGLSTSVSGTCTNKAPWVKKEAAFPQ